MVPLVDIQTQDDNTDDTVDCNLDEITSPQTESAIPQDIFRIRETYTGSMSNYKSILTFLIIKTNKRETIGLMLYSQKMLKICTPPNSNSH